MTREEAIAELKVLHERLSNPKDCEDGCYSWEDGWYVEAIDMAIKSLRTDIVRCKDCRHAEHREQMPNQVYCKRDKLSPFGAVHDDDDFCKYGERREP